MPGNQISAISVHKQQRYKVSHLTFREPLDVPPTVAEFQFQFYLSHVNIITQMTDEFAVNVLSTRDN